jgi:hypothetical protein
MTTRVGVNYCQSMTMTVIFVFLINCIFFLIFNEDELKGLYVLKNLIFQLPLCNNQHTVALNLHTEFAY